MVIVHCNRCGTEFKANPSRIKNGMGKYCSRACMGEARKGENNPMFGRLGENNPNFGKPLSEETKAKMRKPRPSTQGENSHMFGKPLSEETKAKMGERKKGENNPMFGKPPSHGIGMSYESTNNGTLWTRSSYERRFLAVAGALGYNYDWEPRAFPLEIEGKATTYRPDVFIRDLNLWIEIKGYWRDDAKEKFDAFSVRYPEENINIMTIDELTRFENGESLEEIYKGDGIQ